MTSRQLISIAFVGIFLHNVLGQLDVMQPYSSGNTNEQTAVVQEESGTVEVDAYDPNADEDVMARINRAETVEDFLALMKVNGQPVTVDTIYDPMVDENGKEVISDGGRLAYPDNCSPRNTTIRINVENTESDVAFFPRCTKIERCGGCCSSPNLECVPMYTERVSLRVLKGRVPFPGATHLEYTGFAPVIIHRHVTCRVQCKLTPEMCGPKKHFLPQQCMCRCRHQVQPCIPPTMWDPDDCSCKCPTPQPCCNDIENCDMVYNHQTCECEFNNDGRMVISANRANRTVMDSGSRAAVGQSIDVNIPSTPSPTPETTTTTTTTSTTTTPPTTVDPCSIVTCPGNLVKYRNGDECVCRPNRFRIRGRGRNRFRG